jgi:hypothetical protein
VTVRAPTAYKELRTRMSQMTSSGLEMSQWIGVRTG